MKQLKKIGISLLLSQCTDENSNPRSNLDFNKNKANIDSTSTTDEEKKTSHKNHPIKENNVQEIHIKKKCYKEHNDPNDPQINIINNKIDTSEMLHKLLQSSDQSDKSEEKKINDIEKLKKTRELFSSEIKYLNINVKSEHKSSMEIQSEGTIENENEKTKEDESKEPIVHFDNEKHHPSYFCEESYDKATKDKDQDTKSKSTKDSFEGKVPIYGYKAFGETLVYYYDSIKYQLKNSNIREILKNIKKAQDFLRKTNSIDPMIEHFFSFRGIPGDLELRESKTALMLTMIDAFEDYISEFYSYKENNKIYSGKISHLCHIDFYMDKNLQEYFPFYIFSLQILQKVFNNLKDSSEINNIRNTIKSRLSNAEKFIHTSKHNKSQYWTIHKNDYDAINGDPEKINYQTKSIYTTLKQFEELEDGKIKKTLDKLVEVRTDLDKANSEENNLNKVKTEQKFIKYCNRMHEVLYTKKEYDDTMHHNGTFKILKYLKVYPSARHGLHKLANTHNGLTVKEFEKMITFLHDMKYEILLQYCSHDTAQILMMRDFLQKYEYVLQPVEFDSSITAKMQVLINPCNLANYIAKKIVALFRPNKKN